jgi:SNF2 family DNA or RNA helicase
MMKPWMLNTVTTIALKRYRERKLRDLRFYKKLTDEQIEERLNKLPVKPPIWNKLQRHQRICLLAGIKYRRFAYWCDTGTGKTFISLALVRYFDKLNLLPHAVLVLVPTKVVKVDWENEVKKHAPRLSYLVLSGSSANKCQQLNDNPDAKLVVETYGGMLAMLCKKAPRPKKVDELRLVPDRKKIKLLSNHLSGLILDESTAVKDSSKLPFRLCRQLVKVCNIVYTLSATPFNNNPIDLWSQMFLLDKGETLGPNKTIFRAAMFNQKSNGWTIEYTFDKSKRPELHRMLANRSIRYKANQADLPSLSRVKKEAYLTKEAMSFLLDAKEALRRASGNYRETKNAFIRIRQISSGWIGYADDETGTRAELDFAENPKLELLLGLVNSVVNDYKVVIFTDFNFSGAMIGRELAQMGIGFDRLYSKTEDPASIRKRFDTDESMRVLILSNSYGGFGLNLQVAKYGFFFESPVSSIIRKQAERRIERQHSQHEHVFLYDLVTKNTYDQRILDWHSKSGDFLKAVLDGKAET